jgi:hypothetical protein
MYNSFAITNKVNRAHAVSVTGSVGANLHRRREVHHLQGEHPSGDTGCARRADREGAHGATERLMPPHGIRRDSRSGRSDAGEQPAYVIAETAMLRIGLLSAEGV